jgi:hypothetical protein
MQPHHWGELAILVLLCLAVIGGIWWLDRHHSR